MNKSLEQVRSFHELFEHPIAEGPHAEEPLKIRQLRIKLLFEELAELAEASDCTETMRDLCYAAHVEYNFRKDGDNVDKVEELDALCDILYVLNGKVLTSGLHKIFDAAFDTVHNNNMTKAHRDEAHAKETIAKLKEKNPGEEYKTIERNHLFIVQNSHGKVLKPWNHVKVKLDIDELIGEQ